MCVLHNGRTASGNSDTFSDTAVALAKLIDHTIIIDDIKKSRIRIVAGDGFL